MAARGRSTRAAARELYFDLNRETPVHPGVAKTYARWLSKLPVSADDAAALKRKFDETVSQVLAVDPDEYVFWVAGSAEEAGTHIVTATSQAYARLVRARGAAFFSYQAPPGVAESVRALRARGILAERPIEPESNYPGSVGAESLRKVPAQNSCLATVLGADPFTGAINDLAGLGEHCRAARPNIPLHADVSLLIGRGVEFSPQALDLTAFTVNLRQIGGPPGAIVGVRRDYAEGFKLEPLVWGGASPGEPELGGPANLPAMAAAAEALLHRVDVDAATSAAAEGRAVPAPGAAAARRVRVALTQALATWAYDEYREARPLEASRAAATRARAAAARARKISKLEAKGELYLVWYDAAGAAGNLDDTLCFYARKGEAEDLADKLAEARITVGRPPSHAAGLPSDLRGGLVSLSFGGGESDDDLRRLLKAIIDHKNDHASD